MTPKPLDDRSDELPPAEAARARRRDHNATAISRKGMRTGLAKQFKQVLDAQVKRGRTAGAARAAGADNADGADQESSPTPDGPAAPRPRKRGRNPERPRNPDEP